MFKYLVYAFSLSYYSVANIVQTGASIGLQFANKSPMFPNTIKSHAFLEYAKSKDEGINQNRAAELLFEVSFYQYP